MNDADVSKQIQQMVRFIRQEAEEKANEISVSAEEEFNIEKLQLVEAEKKKIRQEYERKEKQVDIRKKIEYSMQLNASRIKVLQAQDDLVSSMKEAASKELLHVSHDHHVYKRLLRDLVVQVSIDSADLPKFYFGITLTSGSYCCSFGMIYKNISHCHVSFDIVLMSVTICVAEFTLKEPAVLLRCRKDDLHLVESILDSAKDEYAGKANVYPPEIIVDHQVYLPPAPSHHHAHGPFCSGGVVLASRDGKIVCENTLDARLDVVFRKKLPEIRKWLFGQVAA
ncbi:V-type proton ATPase subunit E [Vitis vinifera]|uniref:V-type proton ATPase subunit E n=1 Tax=Vitis vinifera TaxID=29760 RepID=A0A438J536_VITVI|nr:V-type proton ATPase subunit E [Vitis vinifera]